MRNRTHIPTVFLILVLLYFLVGGIYLFTISKGDAVLCLNKAHTPTLDIFYKYFTYLGDGNFVVIIVALLLLFFSFYEALVGSVSFALMGITSQLLKKQVFPTVDRPKGMFYSRMDEMNLVEGVRVNTDFSFPSGHTAAGIMVAIILAWVFRKNKALQAVFFVQGFLVGISRIYLFQHFFIDTYFGTLLSVLLAIGVLWYFEEKTELSKKPSWQRNLIQVISKKTT